MSPVIEATAPETHFVGSYLIDYRYPSEAERRSFGRILAYFMEHGRTLPDVWVIHASTGTIRIADDETAEAESAVGVVGAVVSGAGVEPPEISP